MKTDSDYDFLNSLDASSLLSLLSLHPETASLIQPLLDEQGKSSYGTHRDKQIERDRRQRTESARIFIPACVNPQRRERCLADPELLLKTYFARDFTRPFGKLHHVLVDAIWQTATYGGKIALAAPRGRGKSTIVKKCLLACVLAGKVRFPVPIAQTTNDAFELYEDFRRSLMFNDLLFEDFPEICAPVRALEGAPQRAAKQHIDGELTRIQWTADGLRLANVPEKYRGPIDYGGVRLEYRGLDAAIRGINRDGDRPDFVPIDDPETRESAKSDSQIEDRENAIEKDIAGLAGEDKELAQVMITTVQNRKCISFRYTDPEQKPSWMGKRLGWVVKWPDEWTKEDGLWHEYIALRGKDQRAGDRYGRTATEFFIENEAKLIAGGELLADNYKAQVLSDGWITVRSAWQVVFNAIADTNYDAFCTEFQNDPPEVEQIQTIDLSAAHVAACVNDLPQYAIPEWSKIIVRGIDAGKTNFHWVDIAFAMDGTGAIIDYGRFTTHGLLPGSSDEIIELAMLTALQSFAADHCDRYRVDLTMVDSGYKPEAIYEACRRVGYVPLKGPDGNYRQPKESPGQVQCWFNCHASMVPDQYGRKLWLFHPHTEYWKNWLQERFMTDPYVGGQINRGSMTLFAPPGDDIKFHQQFARSMVSERLEHIPIPGSGYKSVWNVIDRANNHFLDAAGYACAAASVLGVRLIPQQSSPPKPGEKRAVRVAQPKRNNNIRSRPGGWMQGIRRGNR